MPAAPRASDDGMTPIPKPESAKSVRHEKVADAASRAETWMMVLLIVFVPAIAGALFQCRVMSGSRARLASELAVSRSMVREVVDELVVARRELEARETQVERLIEVTTLSDNEIRRLRAAMLAWQRHGETLAQTVERKIGELAAQGAEAERLLSAARQQHENERQQMEDDLADARNQLSATSTELQHTQDFARDTTLWNEHLQRGIVAMRGSNQSLGQTLSSTQNALADAQSAASSAQSEADSAEAERNRARRALDRAETSIVALKHQVVRERREEAREHNVALVRPPQSPQQHQTTTPKQPPPPMPPHREPPGGGKGRR